MDWELWRPWYRNIVKRLNLDPEADCKAAEILDELLPQPEIDKLAEIIRHQECIVLGAGPSLDADLKNIETAGWLDKVIIAADGATTAVLKYRNPDVIVTDLDGIVQDQLESWRRGSWIVAHAHGDNIPAVRKFLPQIGARAIGTTQVEPFGKLCNFGGFTDGDRAAFMAYELMADQIYLAGMDLGPKIGKYSGEKDQRNKLIKLTICGELLSWLARLGAPVVNLTAGGRPIKNIAKESLLAAL